LTPDGWKSVTTASDKIQDTIGGCSVHINASSYLIVAGRSRTADPRSTFIFDILTGQLTAGPELIHGRFEMGCSRLMNKGTGLYDTIAVVGGVDAINSYMTDYVDLLDLRTMVWSEGPNFPMKIGRIQVVEHYKGGIITVGGLDGSLQIRSELYYLASRDDPWVKLKQHLRVPRFSHTAFLVHKDLNHCN